MENIMYHMFSDYDVRCDGASSIHVEFLIGRDDEYIEMNRSDVIALAKHFKLTKEELDE